MTAPEREGRAPTPAPLPQADGAEPDPDAAQRATLRMEGGAMGRMGAAMMGGRSRPMRELAAQGKVWAFNGMAEMPDRPLLTAAPGESVRIAMLNDTAWPHAMHLHGTHFREVYADGAMGPWRDTLLVQPDETREIAFVAENKGDWMFHCHMLSHQSSGMMNWIRVS